MRREQRFMVRLSRILIGLIVGGLFGRLIAGTPAPVPPPIPRPPKPPTVAHPRVSSTQAKKKKGAWIVFQKEVYDFGRVVSGKLVKAEFVFTNIGDTTLYISSVTTSCGCTTTGKWPKEVPPGGVGKIPVQLNTQGYAGRVTKSITIINSSVNKPSAYLKLTGEVWLPVTVRPTYAYFRMLADETNLPTASVTITSSLPKPLKILSIEDEKGYFVGKLKEVKKGKEFQFIVQPKKHYPKGSYADTFHLKTNSKQVPEIKVYAFLNVKPRMEVYRDRIILPGGPLTLQTRRYLLVRSNDGVPFRVKKVEVIGIPGAKASFAQLVRNLSWRIAIDFPKGLQLKAGDQPFVRILTDRAGYEEFKIPILQPAAPVPAKPKSIPVPSRPLPSAH